MEIMRLVVAGPVGAGKSTFIRAVSEIETVNTDRLASDETSLLKAKTTVGFDFGRVQFGPERILHLYGTPGQERFDFMWEELISKAHAYILLVSANQPETFRQARLIYQFMSERVLLPVVVGVTHTDCEEARQIEEVAIALNLTAADNSPPFISLNPKRPVSVNQALALVVRQRLL